MTARKHAFQTQQGQCTYELTETACIRPPQAEARQNSRKKSGGWLEITYRVKN